MRAWAAGDTRPGPAALIAEINKIPRDLPQPDPSQPQVFEDLYVFAWLCGTCQEETH